MPVATTSATAAVSGSHPTTRSSTIAAAYRCTEIFVKMYARIEMLARYTLLARLKRRSRNSGIVKTFERR